MTDYPIRHSCGHSGAVHVGSQHPTNAEKREIWKGEKRLCPACYSAACEAETAKKFGKLPAFAGTPNQVMFAQDVLQRLLVGLPIGITSMLLSQETLEAAPLLDAWQSVEHRDRETLAGPRKWQYLVLREAYPQFVAVLPKDTSDPGDVKANIRKIRTIA